MENEHVIPASNDVNQKSSVGKKIAVVFISLVSLIALGVGAFFLGKRSNSISPASISPTPTPAITASSTPTEKPEVSTTSAVSKTPTPSPKTKTLSSSATLDGFQSSNGGGNLTLEIRAGRNVNLVSRGFVSFDLSEIPEGAKIQEATLRLFQAKADIGDPYGVAGNVKIDHLNYGDTLENSDYGVAALSSSFVTLSSNSAVEWKDAVVTDQLKDDLSNERERSQFRVHFQTETTGGDTTGDFVYFEAKENSQSTGNTPQLVIKYY